MVRDTLYSYILTIYKENKAMQYESMKLTQKCNNKYCTYFYLCFILILFTIFCVVRKKYKQLLIHINNNNNECISMIIMWNCCIVFINRNC